MTGPTGRPRGTGRALWGGGEVRSTAETGQLRRREGTSVQDRRRTWRRTWRLGNLTWGALGQELIHSGMCQTPRAASVSEVRARLHDAARFRARSTSHTVAARDGCTNVPLAAGRGSGERNHSINRHIGPWLPSVRPPGSARTDQVLEDLNVERLWLDDFHHGSLDDDAGGDIFP